MTISSCLERLLVEVMIDCQQQKGSVASGHQQPHKGIPSKLNICSFFPSRLRGSLAVASARLSMLIHSLLSSISCMRHRRVWMAACLLGKAQCTRRAYPKNVNQDGLDSIRGLAFDRRR